MLGSGGRRRRSVVLWARAGVLSALIAAPACTTEFPERAEHIACATNDDCPDTERCAEFTPGEFRCWPEAVVCGQAACPDGGDEPLLVPVAPPEPGGCPSARRLTVCDVDDAFCVYEPLGAELTSPCVVLCEALSLACVGTSINLGEVCAIEEYHDDCEMVGSGLGCVCTR
jgi:hypothetical protein